MGRKGIVIEAPGIIQRRVLALDKFAGFSIFFEDGLSLSLAVGIAGCLWTSGEILLARVGTRAWRSSVDAVWGFSAFSYMKIRGDLDLAGGLEGEVLQ